MNVSVESINAGLLYKPFAPHPAWPFILAILAAVVFGLIGMRTRGSAVLWGLSGAIFTLFTSAIVSGLADATAIPYTDAVKNSRQTVALIISILVVGIVGALLSAAAGGVFSRLWARIIRSPGSYKNLT